jgi:hypothetical protein
MQYEIQLELKGEAPMKSTEISPQTTTTKFDGVLVTIRSRKSFFEVTQAIEKALPRFHIPKLMEYVTHGNRAGDVSTIRGITFGKGTILEFPVLRREFDLESRPVPVSGGAPSAKLKPSFK